MACVMEKWGNSRKESIEYECTMAIRVGEDKETMVRNVTIEMMNNNGRKRYNILRRPPNKLEKEQENVDDDVKINTAVLYFDLNHNVTVSEQINQFSLNIDGSRLLNIGIQN